ncbi:MAG: biotin--[acetyl-CoA-carboxylase] ligase [Muribaculaceae bacterium]|nr:biotin--[acetyl-CoA-carboxylase] ligase [Muribaculaceae bacterium]
MVYLESTPSTNGAARQLLAEQQPAHGTVVYTHCQTAGRGQRGNSWEAEPGANVTMSLILRPDGVMATEQFFISECVALAVASVGAESLGNAGEEGTVKWPNDIYVVDRKIAGILIENSLQGVAIESSIAGIGLNVNQRSFVSDAPNPVSLLQLTGREYDVEKLIVNIAHSILDNLWRPREEVHAEYKRRMWRRDGYHNYSTPDGATFEARIAEVDASGLLLLQKADGGNEWFAFKEVAAIL